MKKILLPTDFSENSWNAIKYALQLFKNEECTFFLLNTYAPAVYQVEYLLVVPEPDGVLDSFKENSLKHLESLKERMQTEFSNPKHSIETISIFNTLVEQINEEVKDKSIDYVVMGTKGATGAREVLFGSNTVFVFKKVKCPIIAVPETFTYESPHEILFPTDYGIDYQAEHIQPLLDLIGKNVARVNILHVVKGNGLSEFQEQNKQKLERYFKHSAYVFHSVQNETVQEAITNFQLKVRVNLLVMLNNKHSFFENLFFKSTINQIGFHLNIPFFVIPTKLGKK
ncbi:universal stress protein [Mangrovimonas sp. DI 80]|uniref:universal stress protein n=1 Tax=Mangrovimonas sp. DI 80 TaxID=1779330 RepID=UPI0009783696|nr:universal stress protein [Mangrovimonas sp. DI 80]OMP29987.1 universal stress protein [Mangrovimonas sp. DI 80]